MRAVWMETGTLRVGDIPRPVPGPLEALVRVRLAGICNTDLELLRGYYPFAGVPGHEFVGVVTEAREATSWVGRRVVGEINVRCGACRECAAGRPMHCSGRTVVGIRSRNGAFAEYLTLPLENLHEVPPGLVDEVAVFTEPTAAALRVREQVPLAPRDRALVLGAGKLGCLVAQALLSTGCELQVVTRHPQRVAFLGQRGARLAAADAISERAADLVVECTGSPDGLALARRLVRPRGTIVLKSTYRGEARLDSSALVVDEVMLIGSRCGPFPAALDALAHGEVVTEPLVERTLPLAEAERAFSEAARPGALKILLAC